MRVLGVGVIGCGNVADVYLTNLPLFRHLELRAVADCNADAAALRARQYGCEALSIDAILRRADIDIIVNLTPPSAHAGISMDALSADKNVFSEKPLCADIETARKLLTTADQRGLRVGCAPDTFLGAGGRMARRLMDVRSIGDPLFGTAFILSHGMEHWHPDPSMFFKKGGGPVLDLGPYYVTALINLLGPVARVRAITSTGFELREVTANGPRKGDRIEVETATTALSILEFSGGPAVVLAASWDTWKHGHPALEIYGTEGSMRLPDPNFFGGAVQTTVRNGEWLQHDTEGLPLGAANWPVAAPATANYRGLGVAELARSIVADTPHRASGKLALHGLEVMLAVINGSDDDRPVKIESVLERPALVEDAEASAWFAKPSGVAQTAVQVTPQEQPVQQPANGSQHD